MKYTFQMLKSQDGIPTLIVSLEDTNLSIFGISSKVVNVFTGKEAEDLYDRLIKEAENGKS